MYLLILLVILCTDVLFDGGSYIGVHRRLSDFVDQNLLDIHTHAHTHTHTHTHVGIANVCRVRFSTCSSRNPTAARAHYSFRFGHQASSVTASETAWRRRRDTSESVRRPLRSPEDWFPGVSPPLVSGLWRPVLDVPFLYDVVVGGCCFQGEGRAVFRPAGRSVGRSAGVIKGLHWPVVPRWSPVSRSRPCPRSRIKCITPGCRLVVRRRSRVPSAHGGSDHRCPRASSLHHLASAERVYIYIYIYTCMGGSTSNRPRRIQVGWCQRFASLGCLPCLLEYVRLSDRAVDIDRMVASLANSSRLPAAVPRLHSPRRPRYVAACHRSVPAATSAFGVRGVCNLGEWKRLWSPTVLGDNYII